MKKAIFAVGPNLCFWREFNHVFPFYVKFYCSHVVVNELLQDRKLNDKVDSTA